MQEEKLKSIKIEDEPNDDVDPTKVCTVQFKGPTNQKYVRRFLKESTTINDLINYYKQ